MICMAKNMAKATPSVSLDQPSVSSILAVLHIVRSGFFTPWGLRLFSNHTFKGLKETINCIILWLFLIILLWLFVLFTQFITKVIIAIITQQDVEEPIKCITTDKSQSHSLSTWIHCCVHLSSLLGVGEQWCWCKYVYLLYAAGLYDKGDQVCDNLVKLQLILLHT